VEEKVSAGTRVTVHMDYGKVSGRGDDRTVCASTVAWWVWL